MTAKSKFIYILSVLYACITFKTAAQDSTLCKTYKRLLEESNSKFEKIAGRTIISESDYERRSTTIEVIEAENCYLESTSNGVYWVAEFGTYENLKDAEDKIATIQELLIACVPRLEFIPNTTLNFNINFHFKENVIGGFTLFKSDLGIYQNKNRMYIPIFRVPEKATPTFYHFINNKPDTLEFANGIRFVLSESKTGFKNIQSDQIVNEPFIKGYNTTYCLDNSLGCDIVEINSDRYFEGWYGANLSSTVADSVLNIMEQYLAFALGNKYIWWKIENGTAYGQNSKTVEDILQIIEIRKEIQIENGDQYRIIIRFHDQHK